MNFKSAVIKAKCGHHVSCMIGDECHAEIEVGVSDPIVHVYDGHGRMVCRKYADSADAHNVPFALPDTGWEIVE